jgi:elongator complex protein 2
MVQVESIFTGCNRNLGIFDFHPTSKRIAYGSHNTVSLTTPMFESSGYNTSSQVIATLKPSNGTAGEVTAVRWIASANLLLAGCQDGSVSIWKFSDDSNVEFELSQVLKPSSHSVSCLGFVKNDEKCTDFVVADSAGGVFYYRHNDAGKYEEFVKYELPYGYYAMVIAIIKVNEDEHVLLCGGSKPVIQVLSLNLELNGEGKATDSAMKLEISLPGHDDWVRSIDFVEIEEQLVKVEDVEHIKRVFMFASASLDRVIRLWKLTVEPSDAPVFIETNKLKLLTSKEYKFITQQQRYTVFLDAILMGHDDWVSEVSFNSGVHKESELHLLSSSADSSVMIWHADPVSGVWFPDTRLGEMAIKGASTATGSSGGFYTSRWIKDGDSDSEVILCNGKTGAFRCWTRVESLAEWKISSVMTGPARSITDLSWSSKGDYLLATSLDQSTRLYAQSRSHPSKDTERKWFEFGRPQIHGFDMITVKSISGTRFVSAGDEKVIRVFDMPRDVASMLDRECGIEVEGGIDDATLPEKASLPVLGLSNKAGMDDNTAAAVAEGENREDSTNAVADVLKSLEGPPVEDILQRHTLWPEMEKLYGHGFEITTLDASPDGTIISSACRSNVAKHAVVRNFSTKTWLECGEPLEAHDLTITRLRYSLPGGNEEWLLSVSRDRKFSLWRRSGEKFTNVKIQEKAHSRIIWDCAWLNYDDVVAFVTCSRDREVKLWKMNDKESDIDVVCTSSIKFEVAVTAIDSIAMSKGVFKIIIGLDDGRVYVYLVDVGKDELEEVEILTQRALPGDSISRISVSQQTGTVAIGSRDGSVRILQV